ncbi:MAG: hypothetical protein IRY97_03685, partial [Thermomicrobiaceae bacterium]|nr:hypothetical protein [Thermomicrobiaceae bacterium]
APPTPRGGASGLTVSEVEIESTSPTIRRVVLRTASAWSLSPEALRPEPPRPSRRIARRSARAAGIAGLALLGLAAARRAPLSLPGRSRD